MAKHVLTRDMLEGDAIGRMVAEGAPALRMLTEAERTLSLAETLAARPEPAADEEAGVWLFAYGSLIWNPALHFAERRLAWISGWHRSFCLSTLAGRGTPANPGLVLALDRGGSCAGAAFRIAPALVADELKLLWRREMLSGSYRPRWVRLRGADGVAFGHAIAFTIDRGGHHYTGKLSEAELVRRLATAAGALGSSAEYLFHTRDGLRGLGLRDERVERLAALVAKAQDAGG